MSTNRYIVSYDLSGGTDDDYEDLNKVLYGIGARRIQRSVWVLVSNKSLSDVYASLIQDLDDDDRLFVAPISGKSMWQNPICNEQWLESNFFYGLPDNKNRRLNPIDPL